MNLLSSKGRPKIMDLPCWLFICGDVDALEQVEAFAKSPLLGGMFDMYPSKYFPTPNERLGGHSAKSRLASESLPLLFLIKKEMNIIP